MVDDTILIAGHYLSKTFCYVCKVLDKMTEKINELAPEKLFWTDYGHPLY